MRKIRVTPFHIELANKYLKELTHPECLRCCNSVSEKQEKVNPLCNLKILYNSLIDLSVSVTSAGKVFTTKERYDYSEYIACIISNFEEIITWTPTLLNNIISQFKVFPNIDLKKKLKIGSKKEKAFWEIIVEAMQYKEIRHDVMPKYIRQMGIKTCVYCNANYTVTDSNNVAYYQLDHWKDRSHYPYLSISFFNLQPCCASCNLHKSNDDKYDYLQLYEDNDKEPLDVFEFEFQKGALPSFITDHKASHLKPLWTSIVANQNKVRDDMEKKLHITDIYSEHIDEIEELVWRSLFGRNAFVKALNKSKLGIKLSSRDVDRFILGTYSDPEDVHKRPLTKLKQDLGKELRLI